MSRPILTRKKAPPPSFEPPLAVPRHEPLDAANPRESDTLGSSTGHAPAQTSVLLDTKATRAILPPFEDLISLVNSNPRGFASDAAWQAWGERGRAPLTKAAEQASARAMSTGDLKYHREATRLHRSAADAHRACDEEARTSPGLMRGSHEYHSEKALAHDDLVFARERHLAVNPRLQHHLQGQHPKPTQDQVRATIQMLRHFHRFLASDHRYMVDPTTGWIHSELDKAAARKRLTDLINVAINRRAGIPDQVGRKQSPDYQRALTQDAIDLERRRTQRIRLYQLRTPELQERFGHTLDTPMR